MVTPAGRVMGCRMKDSAVPLAANSTALADGAGIQRGLHAGGCRARFSTSEPVVCSAVRVVQTGGYTGLRNGCGCLR